MTTADPTSTFRLFQHDRVAAGYQAARPYLHPAVLEMLAGMLAGPIPVGRALDVGCGTGLSSIALRGLAAEVVGVDSSIEMLRRAVPGEGVRYAASAAESLPFRSASFNLVIACGSIDWIDRGRFVPEVARLLVDGGWLAPLDFGDSGRSGVLPELGPWYDKSFLGRYPRPFSADPMVTAAEAALAGFEAPAEKRFTIPCTFTVQQYVDFLMTESNVIAAVEYRREQASDVRDWLAREVSRLAAGASLTVDFTGYIQLLRLRGRSSPAL